MIKLKFYRYIDWLMALPAELEQKLDEQVNEYEEAQKMTYVTSIERRGFARGVQQGELQIAQEAVLEVLQIRFGELSESLVQNLKILPDVTTLMKLHKKAIIIGSVAEFEAELAKSLKSLTHQAMP